jgi:hypothetical protein
MKQITLKASRNEDILISPEDEELLAKFTLHVFRPKRSRVSYVMCYLPVKSRTLVSKDIIKRLYRGGSATIHRLIMDPPQGKEVDHINGDSLDNRRENLRICDRTGNSRNVPRVALKHYFSSKYKGVSGQWIARIQAGKSVIHIGTFKTEKEAAGAYNKKALELYGRFARLNKID